MAVLHCSGVSESTHLCMLPDVQPMLISAIKGAVCSLARMIVARFDLRFNVVVCWMGMDGLGRGMDGRKRSRNVAGLLGVLWFRGTV